MICFNQDFDDFFLFLSPSCLEITLLQRIVHSILYSLIDKDKKAQFYFKLGDDPLESNPLLDIFIENRSLDLVIYFSNNSSESLWEPLIEYCLKDRGDKLPDISVHIVQQLGKKFNQIFNLAVEVNNHLKGRDRLSISFLPDTTLEISRSSLSSIFKPKPYRLIKNVIILNMGNRSLDNKHAAQILKTALSAHSGPFLEIALNYQDQLNLDYLLKKIFNSKNFFPKRYIIFDASKIINFRILENSLDELIKLAWKTDTCFYFKFDLLVAKNITLKSIQSLLDSLREAKKPVRLRLEFNRNRLHLSPELSETFLSLLKQHPALVMPADVRVASREENETINNINRAIEARNRFNLIIFNLAANLSNPANTAHVNHVESLIEILIKNPLEDGQINDFLNRLELSEKGEENIPSLRELALKKLVKTGQTYKLLKLNLDYFQIIHAQLIWEIIMLCKEPFGNDMESGIKGNTRL